VTLFERSDRIGGLLRYGIPEFKMEKRHLDRRLALMEKEGVVCRPNADVGRSPRLAELQREFDAVVLACGAGAPRDLPVPGRELPGIHFAMEYLTLSNRRCEGDHVPDERFISAKGKRVVIIGGGDTGADCLGTVHRQGAASVHQFELLPRPPDTRAADIALKAKQEQERKLREENERRAREAKEIEDKRKLEEKQKAERQQKAMAAMQMQAEREIQARQAQQVADATARSRSEADWIRRIQAKVKGNVIVPAELSGNPEAIFEVVQLPTGEIIEATLVKSSGNRAYDDAVQRAIIKSSPLPRPDRSELFQRALTLKFRPQD